MKVDKLMTEVDHGARHAYEQRAAREEMPAAARADSRRIEPPSVRLRRTADAAMGKIYDATWGRVFTELYDRS